MGINILTVDLDTPNADEELLRQHVSIHAPQVLGVVRATGTNESESMIETTSEAFGKVLGV